MEYPLLTLTGLAWNPHPLDRSQQGCNPGCPLWDECRRQVLAGNHAGCERVLPWEVLGEERITVMEAAQILRCDPTTIRSMIADGRLSAQRDGKKWRIPLREVERWVVLSGGEDWQRFAQRRRWAKAAEP